MPVEHINNGLVGSIFFSVTEGSISYCKHSNLSTIMRLHRAERSWWASLYSPESPPQEKMFIQQTATCYRKHRLKDASPSLPSFLPSPFLKCCTIQPTSFGGKGPIWGNDWLHSPFMRQTPSWCFLGLSLAVREMPGYRYTAPRIISLSPLSLATDVTEATLVASGLWLGTGQELVAPPH